MSTNLQGKDGKPIQVGDRVSTRFRGGERKGEVEAVIANEPELRDAGNLGVSVKNPPKVVFTDQHGHKVSHNPNTLSHASHGQDK